MRAMTQTIRLILAPLLLWPHTPPIGSVTPTYSAPLSTEAICQPLQLFRRASPDTYRSIAHEAQIHAALAYVLKLPDGSEVPIFMRRPVLKDVALALVMAGHVVWVNNALCWVIRGGSDKVIMNSFEKALDYVHQLIAKGRLVEADALLFSLKTTFQQYSLDELFAYWNDQFPISTAFIPLNASQRYTENLEYLLQTLANEVIQTVPTITKQQQQNPTFMNQLMNYLAVSETLNYDVTVVLNEDLTRELGIKNRLVRVVFRKPEIPTVQNLGILLAQRFPLFHQRSEIAIQVDGTFVEREAHLIRPNESVAAYAGMKSVAGARLPYYDAESLLQTPIDLPLDGYPKEVRDLLIRVARAESDFQEEWIRLVRLDLSGDCRTHAQRAFAALLLAHSFADVSDILDFIAAPHFDWLEMEAMVRKLNDRYAQRPEDIEDRLIPDLPWSRLRASILSEDRYIHDPRLEGFVNADDLRGVRRLSASTVEEEAHLWAASNLTEDQYNDMLSRIYAAIKNHIIRFTPPVPAPTALLSAG